VGVDECWTAAPPPPDPPPQPSRTMGRGGSRGGRRLHQFHLAASPLQETLPAPQRPRHVMETSGYPRILLTVRRQSVKLGTLNPGNDVG